jgi:hypothetical protein
VLSHDLAAHQPKKEKKPSGKSNYNCFSRIESVPGVVNQRKDSAEEFLRNSRFAQQQDRKIPKSDLN